MSRRSAPFRPAIAAIATPAGRGGIGIVRVSGDGMDPLIAGIAGRPLPPRVATRVDFRAADGGTIDAGIALYFPRPHSYTGEDVVEWHGHGGTAVMRLLLARCLELGARVAEPGEFTKRAFLNGKLDLAQAESVADVIEAATATAVRAAARSLTGEFSRQVVALRDALVDLRLYTEATLDFPEEEDIDLLRDGDVQSRLAAIRQRLSDLLMRARSGLRLREGLTVVLVGAPNVGKSSLLNRLVGEDAAIVTPVPGTTRDTIERRVEVAGIPVNVVDTAGLRATTDDVELMGIARTRTAIGAADVALLIVDARDDVGDVATGVDRDPRIAALAGELAQSLPRIIVHNKCDLVETARVARSSMAATVAASSPSQAANVWLSALTGEGIDRLVDAIQRIVGVEHSTEDAFFARSRHLLALADAAGHLDSAAVHIAAASPPVELFAEDLRGAQHAFSSITGEFTADDLLGEIFARFCIGK